LQSINNENPKPTGQNSQREYRGISFGSGFHKKLGFYGTKALGFCFHTQPFTLVVSTTQENTGMPQGISALSFFRIASTQMETLTKHINKGALTSSIKTKKVIFYEKNQFKKHI
jgi:hypothetical protein